jgi:hypothetical protein
VLVAGLVILKLFATKKMCRQSAKNAIVIVMTIAAIAKSVALLVSV